MCSKFRCQSACLDSSLGVLARSTFFCTPSLGALMSPMKSLVQLSHRIPTPSPCWNSICHKAQGLIQDNVHSTTKGKTRLATLIDLRLENLANSCCHPAKEFHNICLYALRRHDRQCCEVGPSNPLAVLRDVAGHASCVCGARTIPSSPANCCRISASDCAPPDRRAQSSITSSSKRWLRLNQE